MTNHPNRNRRIGRRVKILGGMQEFIGLTGTIENKEGNLYRVELDEPVMIAGVGMVRDDLWEGRYLRTIRDRDGADDDPMGSMPARPYRPMRQGRPE